MAEHGAYGASKIYTVAQLKTLVEFANKRGSTTTEAVKAASTLMIGFSRV